MKLGRGKAPASSTPMVLPERLEDVVLRTADGAKVPARVLERVADTLTVAITGRMRLSGTFVIDDPSDPDLLRMLAPRSIDVLQQRSYVRIHAARPVVVYCGADGGQIQSFTVDVSGGGLLLAGPDTLAIGQEIRFQLSITPGEQPVSGTATVVRIDNMGRRAVAFDTISDHDRRRLVRFIFQCQRAERRRGLRPEDRHA